MGWFNAFTNAAAGAAGKIAKNSMNGVVPRSTGEAQDIYNRARDAGASRGRARYMAMQNGGRSPYGVYSGFEANRIFNNPNARATATDDEIDTALGIAQSSMPQASAPQYANDPLRFSDDANRAAMEYNAFSNWANGKKARNEEERLYKGRNKNPFHQALDDSLGKEGVGGFANEMLGYSPIGIVADTFLPEWAYNPDAENAYKQAPLEFDGDYSMPSAEQMQVMQGDDLERYQRGTGDLLSKDLMAMLMFNPGGQEVGAMGKVGGPTIKDIGKGIADVAKGGAGKQASKKGGQGLEESAARGAESRAMSWERSRPGDSDWKDIGSYDWERRRASKPSYRETYEERWGGGPSALTPEERWEAEREAKERLASNKYGHKSPSASEYRRWDPYNEFRDAGLDWERPRPGDYGYRNWGGSSYLTPARRNAGQYQMWPSDHQAWRPSPSFERPSYMDPVNEFASGSKAGRSASSPGKDNVDRFLDEQWKQQQIDARLAADKRARDRVENEVQRETSMNYALKQLEERGANPKPSARDLRHQTWVDRVKQEGDNYNWDPWFDELSGLSRSELGQEKLRAQRETGIYPMTSKEKAWRAAELREAEEAAKPKKGRFGTLVDRIFGSPELRAVAEPRVPTAPRVEQAAKNIAEADGARAGSMAKTPAHPTKEAADALRDARAEAAEEEWLASRFSMPGERVSSQEYALGEPVTGIPEPRSLTERLADRGNGLKERLAEQRAERKAAKAKGAKAEARGAQAEAAAGEGKVGDAMEVEAVPDALKGSGLTDEEAEYYMSRGVSPSAFERAAANNGVNPKIKAGPVEIGENAGKQGGRQAEAQGAQAGQTTRTAVSPAAQGGEQTAAETAEASAQAATQAGEPEASQAAEAAASDGTFFNSFMNATEKEPIEVTDDFEKLVKTAAGKGKKAQDAREELGKDPGNVQKLLQMYEDGDAKATRIINLNQQDRIDKRLADSPIYQTQVGGLNESLARELQLKNTRGKRFNAGDLRPEALRRRVDKLTPQGRELLKNSLEDVEEGGLKEGTFERMINAVEKAERRSGMKETLKPAAAGTVLAGGAATTAFLTASDWNSTSKYGTYDVDPETGVATYTPSVPTEQAAEEMIENGEVAQDDEGNLVWGVTQDEWDNMTQEEQYQQALVSDVFSSHISEAYGEENADDEFGYEAFLHKEADTEEQKKQEIGDLLGYYNDGMYELPGWRKLLEDSIRADMGVEFDPDDPEYNINLVYQYMYEKNLTDMNQWLYGDFGNERSAYQREHNLSWNGDDEAAAKLGTYVMNLEGGIDSMVDQNGMPIFDEGYDNYDLGTLIAYQNAIQHPENYSEFDENSLRGIAEALNWAGDNASFRFAGDDDTSESEWQPPRKPEKYGWNNFTNMLGRGSMPVDYYGDEYDEPGWDVTDKWIDDEWLTYAENKSGKRIKRNENGQQR